MKRFALIGAAGYVAPRHMEAILNTGNDLVCALDPHDSVGILDRYFPNTRFFKDFERFDRHLNKLEYEGDPIDYISICSPNYLHDPHIRLALRNKANVICEKPLVLNPDNLYRLKEMEKEYGKKVYSILQLRHHPSLIDVKNNLSGDTRHDVRLKYITSRGQWYFTSWKGKVGQSGGLPYNIGIHFFDMLTWMFGSPIEISVESAEEDKIEGAIFFENADVRWFLSVNSKYLPKSKRDAGEFTYRWFSIDGQEVEFSKGFTDLHTVSYSEILEGRGFSIEDSFPGILLANDINERIRAAYGI